jgi:hypothetical protein
MRVIRDVEQGTAEWHALRRGKVTGSKLECAMGTPRARAAFIAELIAEEASEQSKIIRPSAAMERGTNEEPFAIKAFEELTGKKVTRVGVCISDENDWHAHSPDGLIADKKGEFTEEIEVKCPETSTAILYRIDNLVDPVRIGLRTKKGEPTAAAPFCGAPADYKWQIVNGFLVNEKRQVLHFVVYDARIIAEEHKLYIIEIRREHPELQAAMAEARGALKAFRQDWLEIRDKVLPIEI